jgi:hypothetical protein
VHQHGQRDRYRGDEQGGDDRQRQREAEAAPDSVVELRPVVVGADPLARTAENGRLREAVADRPDGRDDVRHGERDRRGHDEQEAEERAVRRLDARLVSGGHRRTSLT